MRCKAYKHLVSVISTSSLLFAQIMPCFAHMEQMQMPPVHQHDAWTQQATATHRNDTWQHQSANNQSSNNSSGNSGTVSSQAAHSFHHWFGIGTNNGMPYEKAGILPALSRSSDSGQRMQHTPNLRMLPGSNNNVNSASTLTSHVDHIWTSNIMTDNHAFQIWSNLGANNSNSAYSHSAPSLNLDLSSNSASMTAGNLLHHETVTIDVGGTSLLVNGKTELTSAEYMAAMQVLSGVQQSLVIDAQGQASGGTVVIGSHLSSELSSLVIPQGVTVIDLTKSGTLNLNGNLTDSGNLYLGSFNPSVNTITVNANNITVQAQGTLSSKDSLDLVTTSGNITNAGLISSTNGNINISSSSTNNINIYGSDANGNIGTFQALNGNINIRDASYDGSANININNGNFLSQNLNLYSGTGTINGDLGLVTGSLNSYAQTEHIFADTPNLVLGNTCVTGDPIFANTGDITISGQLNFGANDVAIVAQGSIFSDTGSNTATITTNGGSVYLIAGADLSCIGCGITDGSYSGTVSGTTSAISSVIFQLDGANQNVGGSGAGNIDFTSGTYTSSTNVITTNGGTVNLIAYSASNGTDGFGNIVFSNSASTMPIINSSNTNGQGGNVLIIAGGNNISIGGINTTGSTTSGNVSIYAATPTIVGHTGTFTGQTGFFSTNAYFIPSSSYIGAISTNEIDTYTSTGSGTSGNVTIIASGGINIETSISSGQAIETHSSSGTSGNISLMSFSGSIQTGETGQTNGELNALTTSGTAGNVIVVAQDGIAVNGGMHTEGGTSGSSGSIYLLAATGNITTYDIETHGSDSAGNIAVAAPSGSFTIESNSDAINSSNSAGNAGNIVIAAYSSITAYTINASGTGGGSIGIVSHDAVSTDSITASNNGSIYLSSATGITTNGNNVQFGGTLFATTASNSTPPSVTSLFTSGSPINISTNHIITSTSTTAPPTILSSSFSGNATITASEIPGGGFASFSNSGTVTLSNSGDNYFSFSNLVPILVTAQVTSFGTITDSAGSANFIFSAPSIATANNQINIGSSVTPIGGSVLMYTPFVGGYSNSTDNGSISIYANSNVVAPGALITDATNAGDNAGNITIQTGGYALLGMLSANGGNNSSTTGGNGGAGGTISISATNNIATLLVFANGGDNTDTFIQNMTAGATDFGNGGAAGTITITSQQGSITSGDIAADGGGAGEVIDQAGDCSNFGNSGTAGNVAIHANSGYISISSIYSVGGFNQSSLDDAGGDSNYGNSGSGGTIAITALNNINIAGSIASNSGHVAGGSNNTVGIDTNYNNGSTGGNIYLTSSNASVLINGSIISAGAYVLGGTSDGSGSNIANGGNGGTIELTAANQVVVGGFINSSGGYSGFGADNSAGGLINYGNGGAGGAITVSASTISIGNSNNNSGISSVGGNGSGNDNSNNGGDYNYSNGGTGGSIILNASTGYVSIGGSIASTGGSSSSLPSYSYALNGDYNWDNGGQAGIITIYSGTYISTSSTIDASGGNASQQAGSLSPSPGNNTNYVNGGAGNSILLNAGSYISVTGTISSNGGNSYLYQQYNAGDSSFGDGGTAGNINLTGNAGSVSLAAVNAMGGSQQNQASGILGSGGNGGNLTIQSNPGNTSGLNLSDAINVDGGQGYGTGGNGGNVTLIAPTGTLTLAVNIDASGGVDNGYGGSVQFLPTVAGNLAVEIDSSVTAAGNNAGLIVFNGEATSPSITITGTGTLIAGQAIRVGNLNTNTKNFIGNYSTVPYTNPLVINNISISITNISGTLEINGSTPTSSSNSSLWSQQFLSNLFHLALLQQALMDQQSNLNEQIGTRIATDYTPWTTYPQQPNIQFPLQGSISFNSINSAPGQAIFATTGFNANELLALSNQGIVFGTQTTNNFLDLIKGFVLFMPQSNISVQTREGLVSIPKGAHVWIMETGADAAIYDLHDDLHTGPVKVKANGKEFTLAPGTEILLTRDPNSPFEKLNPGNELGYRNIRSTDLGGGIKAFVCDFSISHGMTNMPVIRNLLKSNDPAQRKAAWTMIKNAAILADLTGSNYKTGN